MLEVEDKSPITVGQHVMVKLCRSANAREALSKHEGGATTEQQENLWAGQHIKTNLLQAQLDWTLSVAFSFFLIVVKYL